VTASRQESFATLAAIILMAFNGPEMVYKRKSEKRFN